MTVFADAASGGFVTTAPANSGGPVNDAMQEVYTYVFWASVVLGVTVATLLLISFIRFRRRHDDDEPDQVHGNTKLEIAWTAVPLVVFLSLFAVTAAHMGYIADPPDSAMQMRVVGQQFSWTYVYTGHHRRNGDEVSVISCAPPPSPQKNCQMMVPADTPIALDLQSKDVNHSFYVPTLAGQMNAIPGQDNHMWLQARLDNGQPAHYYGQCTELCGTGHSGMLLEIVALPKAQFYQWLSQQELK